MAVQTQKIIIIYIYISYFYYFVLGVWFNLLEDQGLRDRVILLVRECIWNALVVLLGLPTFDDTDSLGYLPQTSFSRFPP